MPSLGVPELLIIAVLLVLLFGARRLPDAARSLGRSMRIFKSEVKEMQRDGEEPKSLPQNAPQATPAPQNLTQKTADYRDTL